MSSEPLVSAYQRTQRESLLAFRRAFYGSDTYRTDTAYVDWAFSDVYQCQSDRAALYVCERDGRVVGAQGASHFQLRAGREQLPSAWITDFAVLKELQRSQGIGTAIAQTSRENNPVRFAMNITPAAVALALRDGWQLVCELPAWARPLDVGRTLKHRAHWLAHFPIHLPAQWLLDGALQMGLRLATHAQLHLVPAEAFDERSDALWSTLSSSYEVSCVRDSAFLQWRFDRFPRREVYDRFWLFQGEMTVGYVVLRMGYHNGLPSASIVDYMCHPRLVGKMLALALNVCRKRGAAIAYCTTLNPTAGARFRALGFLKRKSGWQFMAYTRKCSTEIARILSQPHSWFVTMADSNLDHESAMAQGEPTVLSSS